MSNNLTKEILLRKFTTRQTFLKEIRETVQLTLDAIQDALIRGQNVELRNFGVFEVQVRKASGRNPNQPEKDVVIPKRAVIKFKSGKEMRGLAQIKLDD